MNTQRVEGHTPYRLSETNSAVIVNQAGEVLADCLGGLCKADGAANRAALVLHAVNNIERLEKVNEALVRALELIANTCPDERYWKIARDALAKEPA